MSVSDYLTVIALALPAGLVFRLGTALGDAAYAVVRNAMSRGPKTWSP